MPEYLSPGVYIEELKNGPRPIEGVGTACAAFVGFAASGPVGKPQLVTNWSQFVDKFGALEEGGARNPYIPGAYLAHAVSGYFANGGGRCYVARIGIPGAEDAPAPNTVKFLADAADGNTQPMLSVQAKGTPTSDMNVEVAKGSSDETFTLRIDLGSTKEEYPDICLRGGKGKKVSDAVNSASRLVTVTDTSPKDWKAGAVKLKPAVQTITGIRLEPLKRLMTIVESAPSAGAPKAKKRDSSSTTASSTEGDGAASATSQSSTQQQPIKLTASTFAGDVSKRTGVEGLALYEDITMVCCPDLLAAYENGLLGDVGTTAAKDAVKAAQQTMIEHCVNQGGRVAILDPLPDLAPQEMKQWRDSSNYDAAFAALYYPWLKVMDPISGEKVSVPPSGHIAGIYARSDRERGVHKAPANEDVRGALEAATEITKGEQDVLNPVGVNCIRSFTGRGLRVWGARTLSSDAAWRYINVRRLFNYVEKSIERSTQWVVFEPNDPDLWSRVRRDISAFLVGVWRSGALFGATPEQAFFVKCDEETNPFDVRDRGQLVIEVGLAPVKPAEFVIFRFSQYVGGGS